VTDLVSRLRAAGCVFAEEEAEVLTSSATSPAQLEEMVARRVAGDPLEHVVGWVAFDGARVAVEPGVFVPRQRTAYLVELAAPLLSTGDTVLDLCCGSGALGLALARRVPGISVHASDIDPVAVACAARNLAPVGGSAVVGDLAAALPPSLQGNVAVLVANVPYVPSAAVALMPPESRDHEPRGTVDGGDDGLDLLRRVAALAPAWLRPGGVLLCEVSQEQAPVAATAFVDAGLVATAHHDEERETTAVSGARPGPAAPPRRPGGARARAGAAGTRPGPG
jgi:release factor glutamine methyltransferase